MGTIITQETKSLSPGMRFFFARVFPWPFLLTGLFVLYLGAGDFKAARDSTGWPKAKGKVIVSKMDSKSNSDGTTFHATVAYSYEVGGVKFASSNVGYGDYGTSDPAHAQEILNRYPLDSAVEVSYRPDRPSECVLETGVRAQTFFLPAFGLLFTAAGGVMLVYLPRMVRKLSESPADDSEESPLSPD